MTKPAAIYARVSSDRQKEDDTIASQTAALIQYAEMEGFAVPKEWIFQDKVFQDKVDGAAALLIASRA
jgi:site-specific DNA recombinase